MPIVAMPNGDKVSFPDDMPKEQIRDLIAKKFPDAVPQGKPQVEGGSPDFSGAVGGVRAGSEGIQAGLLGGYDDELAGALLSPLDAARSWVKGEGFDIGRSYGKLQKGFDKIKQMRREQAPVASIGGELAGGLTLGGGAARAGLTTIGRMGVVPGAMVEGGAYGALYGSGEAKPGERLAGAANGAAVGVGTGLVAGRLGNAIMNRRGNSGLQGAEALRNQANALYTASEQAGVRIRPTALQTQVTNLRLRMAPQLRNERLYNDTIGIIDYLDDAARNTNGLQLRDVDELRQVVGESIQGADARNRRTLMMVRDAIDDFTENLTPGMAMGNIRDGVRYLTQAREMWAQRSKQEVVEQIFEKARNQATGFENGLRVHFRALANNPRRFAQFNRQEQDAIRRIVRGGPVENILRAFAWMSPQKTLGAVTTGLTAAEGGIGPASALAGLGMAATRGAQGATVRNVTNLERTIQGVGMPPLPMLYRQSIPALSGTASREVVRR